MVITFFELITNHYANTLRMWCWFNEEPGFFLWGGGGGGVRWTKRGVTRVRCGSEQVRNRPAFHTLPLPSLSLSAFNSLDNYRPQSIGEIICIILVFCLYFLCAHFFLTKCNQLSALAFPPMARQRSWISCQIHNDWASSYTLPCAYHNFSSFSVLYYFVAFPLLTLPKHNFKIFYKWWNGFHSITDRFFLSQVNITVQAVPSSYHPGVEALLKPIKSQSWVFKLERMPAPFKPSCLLQ